MVFFLTLIGGWLRWLYLTPESLYFADEGGLLSEARFFAGQSVLAHPSVFAKPLHGLILSLGFWLGGGQIDAVQNVQVVIATLWIPVIFFLAKSLTESNSIAFLAALLTTFDPWIYIYSRHLLSEPLCGLLWMLSLLFLLSRSPGSKPYILSALFYGLTLLTSRRMALFGLSTFLFVILRGKENLRQRVGHGVAWLGFCLAPLMAFHWIYSFIGARNNLSIEGTASESSAFNYFRQLIRQFTTHNAPFFTWENFAWQTYPTLIFTYEGILLLFFLLLGIIGIVARPQRKVPFLFFISTYLLPIFMFVFLTYAHLRIWSSLLFWHAILAAIGIKQIAQWLSQKSHLRAAVWSSLFTLIVLISFLPQTLAIMRIKVPYRQAFTWLQEHHQPGEYLFSSLINLTSQMGLSWGFLGEVRDLNITLYPEEAHYLMLDHYQFLPSYSHSIRNESSLPKLASNCRPSLQLKCEQSKEFWEHVAWEHNVNFRETLLFLKEKNIKDRPCLEIYDMKACVTELSLKNANKEKR